MSLPKILTPHTTITVDGEEVDIRALTRAEAARFQKMVRGGADMAAVEVAILAAGTDTPPAETQTWYETTPSYSIDPIIEAIKDLSQLSDGAQKSSGTSDSTG